MEFTLSEDGRELVGRHYTIRLGTDGRWNSISGPRRSNHLVEVIEGKASAATYAAELREQATEQRAAFELLGKRPRRRFLSRRP